MYHFVVYPSCFVGSEAALWLSCSKYCPAGTIQQAVTLGRRMQQLGYLHHGEEGGERQWKGI